MAKSQQENKNLVGVYLTMVKYGVPPLVAWGILSIIYLIGVAIGSITIDTYWTIRECIEYHIPDSESRRRR